MCYRLSSTGLEIGLSSLYAEEPSEKLLAMFLIKL